MKRSSRRLSKSGLTENGLKRDFKNKVWLYKGKEYSTLKEVVLDNMFDTKYYKKALKKRAPK